VTPTSMGQKFCWRESKGNHK